MYSRPAHDSATEHVEDYGQIQKPLASLDVGGVRYPQHVCRLRTEVPTYQIRSAPCPRVLPRGVWPAPPARTMQPGHAHQACDSLATDVHAFTCELRMDTWRTIRAARARVQRTDTLEQLRIAALHERFDGSRTSHA